MEGGKKRIFHVSAWYVFFMCEWTHLVKAEAAEGSLLWQEVAKSGRAADVGRIGGVALHKTGGTQQERIFRLVSGIKTGSYIRRRWFSLLHICNLSKVAVLFTVC